MAVLSVWQPFVPLGNFGTVRCGQRLESTLVTRRLFSATCGSSKRHTAPCAISSALADLLSWSNLLPSGPCVADRNGTPHRVPFGLPLAGFFSRYVTSSWRVSTPNLPRFRSKEGRHI